MKKTLIVLAVLLGMMTVARGQNTVGIPYAESFEDGLAGWTAVDGDGDGLGWRVVDCSTMPPMFARALGWFAYDGIKVAYSESADDDVQLHPSNWLISPALTIPVGDSTMLSWWVKTRGAATGDIYEVRIGMVSNMEVDTLDYFDILLTDTVSATTYSERTVSLGDYAGMLVRVAFRHIGGDASLQLDYVRFGNDSLPIVAIHGPMGVDVGDTATYTAMLRSGSTDGLGFEWLCADADYIEYYDGDTTRMMWTAGMLTRVGVVAANSYGVDTAWLDVSVSNCGVIDSIPFVETFATLSATRSCWKMLDLDGGGTAWTFDDGEARSSSITFWGLFPEQDNWLISPSLAIDYTTRQLSWQVKSSSTDRPAEHYSVLIGTSTDVYDTSSYTEVFSETMSDASGWATRYLSLAEYEDDTIRIAFRHYATDDQEYLSLKDFTVEQATAPIVSLSLPSLAIVGDEVTPSLDVFSALPITDVTWTLTTDTLGSTTTVSTLAPFAYTWPDGTPEGYYMVVVEVSNDEGTTVDSAWLFLRVCEVDSVPYIHTFGLDEDCWRIGNGWYVGDTLTVGGIAEPATVSFSHDELGNDLQADNTIATPWLFIPDGGYELRFAAAEVPNLFFDDARMDRFSVIVRTRSTADTIYEGLVSSDAALEYRFHMGPYADSTVQIVFRHHDSPSGFGMRLAAVGVQPIAPPVVSVAAPLRARVNDDVTLAASVVSSETLIYNWQIAGATPAVATGSPVTVHWDTSGTYTIHLVVTSPLYGNFTDSATITIVDCNGTAELPYAENFNLDMGCWNSYDLDGDGYGWEMAVGGSFVDMMFAQGLAYGGTGNSIVSWSLRPSGDLLSYVLGTPGTPLQADNLIVSPAIALPSDGNLQAVFHIAGVGSILTQTQSDAVGSLDSFAIMLTTVDGSDLLADYDVLLPLQAADSIGFGTYSVSLDAWRGQTVHMAVRHRGNATAGLLLDEVSVYAAAPLYTVTVRVADDAMGTVSGGGTYVDGTTVTLVAVPNAGYRFDHWNDADTTNPRTVTVTADAIYTAYFVPLTQGIDDVEPADDITVYSADGFIVVRGADSQPVQVYDMVGRRLTAISRRPEATHCGPLPNGIYVVRIGSNTVRKVVVIR